MLQIIETRILSVVAYTIAPSSPSEWRWFGMTAGSLFVYFRQSLFPHDRLLESLVWICAAFAIAVIASAFLTISTVLTGSRAKLTFS